MSPRARKATAPAEPQIDEAQLALEAQQQRTAIEGARAVEVRGQEGIAMATAACAEAKAQRKKLDDQRKSATAPLRATIKTIDGWFAPALEALDQLEAVWKGKIVEARGILERERMAALRAAEAERAKAEALKTKPAQEKAIARAQEHEAAARAVAPAKTEGLRVSHVWKWEVTDAEALPRELRSIVPNGREISAIVAREKDGTAIPGIRVWCEEQIGIGGGK